VFGLPAGPRQMNFGQFTEAPHEPGPGDQGTAEVRKRFSETQPPPQSGSGGYQQAVRRGYVTGGTETPPGGE
jgi:hypothetical protein